MPTPNRFEIVATLPSQRRHLHVAVDRGTRPPCPVVLALYPRALSDDPGRLARLAGEMERAAQLFHPNVLAPVGMEAVGENLAAVTVWRDATTLRDVLDAGGALPHEIAARIAADVCAGLSHAHGRPQPVVHGLLRPEAVLLDESGIALVSGFGMPGGSGIADDVLGVGELLHECLVGELPDDVLAPLAESEAPPPLVAVVNQARSAVPEARHPTADALGAAIAGAVPLAARETVAAYVNAVLPAQGGVRAERREKIEAALASAAAVPPEEFSEEITDEDILAGDTSLPAEDEPPEPGLAPEPDLAPTSMAPEEDPDAGWDHPDAGEAGGSMAPEDDPYADEPEDPSPAGVDAMVPSSPSPSPAVLSEPLSIPLSASAAPAASAPRPAPASPAKRTPIPVRTLPSAASTPSIPTGLPAASAPTPAAAPPGPVHEERRALGGRRVSLETAIAMCLGGVALGFALAAFTPWHGVAAASLRSAADALAPARASESAAAERAPASDTALPEDERAPDPPAPAVSAQAAPAPTPAPARRASAPAREKKSRVRQAAAAASGGGGGLAQGLLDVTAPEGTEIWLDGRRIGTGNTRREIPVGNHRVEARRGGARIGESFHLAPGETWTYAITPR